MRVAVRLAVFPIGLALSIMPAAALGRAVVIDETNGINFANCANNICAIPMGITVDFGAGPSDTLFVSNRGLFALSNTDLNKSPAAALKDFGQSVFSPAFANATTANFTWRGPNPSATNNPDAFKLRYDLNFANGSFTTVQFIITPTGGTGFQMEYLYGDGFSTVDLGQDTVIGYSFGNADFVVRSGDPGINDRINDQNNASFLFRFPLNSVPEPATWATMVIGFGFAGLGARRSAKRRTLAQA